MFVSDLLAVTITLPYGEDFIRRMSWLITKFLEVSKSRLMNKINEHITITAPHKTLPGKLLLVF
jgi:hypothetical protein